MRTEIYITKKKMRVLHQLRNETKLLTSYFFFLLWHNCLMANYLHSKNVCGKGVYGKDAYNENTRRAAPERQTNTGEQLRSLLAWRASQGEQMTKIRAPECRERKRRRRLFTNSLLAQVHKISSRCCKTSADFKEKERQCCFRAQVPTGERLGTACSLGAGGPFTSSSARSSALLVSRKCSLVCSAVQHINSSNQLLIGD